MQRPSSLHRLIEFRILWRIAGVGCAAVMAGMFLATAAFAQESPARTAPNIVLILADDK